MAATTARKTTTNARKPASRKTPRGAAKPAADLGLVLDDAESQAETDALLADREPLFTVGGITYTIPKEVPPSWTLKAFELASTEGESAALAFAVQHCLDEDGWSALVNCETLSRTNMRKVLQALMDKVLPEGVLVPKASPTSGTNDSAP